MSSGGSAPVTEAADQVVSGGSPAQRLWRRLRRIQLATWFLLVGGGLGFFLVLAIPPAQGLDEPNHFSRVWTLTNGAIIPPSRGPHEVVWIYPSAGIPPSQPVRSGVHRAGGLVPACVQRYLAGLYADGATPGHFVLAEAWRVPVGCATQPARFVAFENTALESPVAYAPEVVGVGLLRGVGASLPVIFFGGRLAGLLGYLALVWIALRFAERGRAALFVVATMPMALQEASAYSADGMTIGLALLSVALALRCLHSPKAGRRTFVALAVVLVALALTKPSYVVLALLVFLVPRELMRMSTARALLAKSGVLLLAALASGAWYAAVHGVTLAAYFPPGAIKVGTQLTYIVHHPIGYVGVVFRSVGQGFGTGGWLAGFVASIGFYPNGHSPFLPLWAVILAFLVLMGAYAVEVGPRVPRSDSLGIVRTWAPVALFFVGVLAVFTTLWTEWTAVGSSSINGLQGRYLLPLATLPVVTLVLSTKRSRTETTWWIVATMVVLAVAAVVMVVGTFY